MGSNFKFSLEEFDSNVCLNCSVKFTNDGEMEIKKIRFLEVLDEEHEAVSVFSALNSALKITINRQIEELGISFGCCPACSTVLGNLYELQRQLDMLRSMDSVVSKILEADQVVAEQLESEPRIMYTYDTKDEKSEITEESPLRLSPEDVEVEIRPGDSEFEHNTNTTSPASGQSQAEPIPVPLPILNPYFSTTTSRCINCCVDIEYSATGSYRNPLAKQAVGAVMCSGAPVKIQIADILNNILKLPLQNNLTADFKMCIDCARMLLHVHVCYSILESVAKPGSHLNFIYQQMRSFIVTGFIRNSYGFSNTVSLPVPVTNISHPSSQTERVTQSSNDAAAKDTGRARQPESMDFDTGSVPEPRPNKKHVMSAEWKVRCTKQKSEFQMKTPVITHDFCPYCGMVVLRSKYKNAMESHIKLYHNFISALTCNICGKGKPCACIAVKQTHKKTHFSSDERAKLRKVDPTPIRLCPEYGKTLTSESSLKSHMKRMHADIETRRIRCQEINCDYTCLDKGHFKRHMKEVHDPTIEPKHRCKICDQSFRMYNELKEHEMTTCEAFSRPFACDQGTCSRRFKLKHALMLHFHSVHTLTPEEARRKLYPDLDCPDWIYNRRSKREKNQSTEKKTPKK